MKLHSKLAPVLASLGLAAADLACALPWLASGETGSLLLARSIAAANADNSTQPTINTNSTADCTNCTNLGNFVNPIPVSSDDPVVQVKNGSYAGITIAPIAASDTLSGFGTNATQEAFLGIPYAQQPVRNLRFRRPQSLNESWNDVRSAKRYSEMCYSVGPDDDYAPPYVTYKLGEQCLTLNVVRPSGVSQDQESKLPVYVWIHGGAFTFGGSADKRYNGSFIVDKSVELGQPVMFVSLNYRVGLLGFPAGDVAENAGIMNLGLYDQRLALNWIRDNIEAFGGDKDKVTIVGESAGGASMLYQLSAYGGRDDKLFRSAIVQSGYWGFTLPTNQTISDANQYWTSLENTAGCGSANGTWNSLDCLRNVPLETIKQWSVQKLARRLTVNPFNPFPDGDIVEQDMQKSFLENKFVKDVGVVLNNNLDEGISFGVYGVNNTEDIVAAINDAQGLPNGWDTDEAKSDLARLYPDNEDIWPPYQAGAGLLPPQQVAGKNDRRSAAIFGDLIMVGPRRQAAEQLSRASNKPVYVSSFDQLAYKQYITGGAQHFQEVAFTLRNPLDTQNALGPLQKDINLANYMASYWISFVATGDPNTARDQGKLGNEGQAPYWPRYEADGDRKSVAWVHDGLGHRSQVKADTYREQGMRLLMDLRAGSYSHDKYRSISKRDEL